VIRQAHALKFRTVICSKTCINKFLSPVCFWIVLKISFSNSCPWWIRGSSFISVGEILGACWFRLSYEFATFHGWIIMLNVQEVFIWNAIKTHALPNFIDYISFETSQLRNLAGSSSSEVGNGVSTWASTCHQSYHNIIPLRAKYSPQRPVLKHIFKTTGEIIHLYILSFTFLDSRREDVRFKAEL
jgi:hypothetical protein